MSSTVKWRKATIDSRCLVFLIKKKASSRISVSGATYLKAHFHSANYGAPKGSSALPVRQEPLQKTWFDNMWNPSVSAPLCVMHKMYILLMDEWFFFLLNIPLWIILMLRSVEPPQNALCTFIRRLSWCVVLIQVFAAVPFLELHAGKKVQFTVHAAKSSEASFSLARLDYSFH